MDEQLQANIKAKLDLLSRELGALYDCLDEGKDSQDTDESVFARWQKDAIVSKLAGVRIAPEDVKINFGDIGTVRDGNVYFTYDQALELEEKYLKPNGWRLPTRREWVLICEEFGGAGDTKEEVGKLVKALNLKQNGRFDPDDDTLYNQGARGGYWSRTADSSATLAYYFVFYASGFNPQGYSNKGHGFSVRCVSL